MLFAEVVIGALRVNWVQRIKNCSTKKREQWRRKRPYTFGQDTAMFELYRTTLALITI